ncbi:MAG TPA: ribose-5-phosphate isomerase RpiA [Pirellulaceae bacterium]|nr:ribose-5-phosphate isomerase RpiA [Pirellulaceae bacterium]
MPVLAANSLQDAEKRLAARHAAQLVKDGMLVGLGSGSTSACLVRELGRRVREEGLKIVGVPTSSATRSIALEEGLQLRDDLADFTLDIAFDGADQTTRQGEIIKGGGGALLHERLVAVAAKQFVIMADASKLVEQLGGFPVPVELFQLGWKNAARRLAALGVIPQQRIVSAGQPLITDEGNFILDCPFTANQLADPETLADQIRAIPGVADHGLFLNVAHRLLIARGEQVEEILLPPRGTNLESAGERDPQSPQRLLRVPSVAEAIAIVTALAEYGIEAFTTGSFTAGFQAEAPGDVAVTVRRGDYARATAALSEIQATRGTLDWSQIDVGDADET